MIFRPKVLEANKETRYRVRAIMILKLIFSLDIKMGDYLYYEASKAIIQ
jgi:hypothetical protein